MSESTLDNIGAKIKEGRTKMGLTQEQFADRYNYPRTTIAKIEAGLRDIKSAEIVTFAEQLGVSCDYLLGRQVVKAPDNLTQAANERYGLSEAALNSLCNIAPQAVQNKSPGFVEITSAGISATAVLSAINAILTDKSGLAMLQAFNYAVEESTTASIAKEITADTTDRNLVKQQEYAELLQFRAWQAFNRAIDSISLPKSEV